MSESPLSFIWLGSMFDTDHAITWPNPGPLYQPPDPLPRSAVLEDWKSMEEDIRAMIGDLGKGRR